MVVVVAAEEVLRKWKGLRKVMQGKEELWLLLVRISFQLLLMKLRWWIIRILLWLLLGLLLLINRKFLRLRWISILISLLKRIIPIKTKSSPTATRHHLNTKDQTLVLEEKCRVQLTILNHPIKDANLVILLWNCHRNKFHRKLKKFLCKVILGLLGRSKGWLLWRNINMRLIS